MMRFGDGVDDWIFATYVYNKEKRSEYWQGMEPLGVQWGPRREQTINVSAGYASNGLEGRLNGPADNPMSSCLSCHARAQWRELPSDRLPFVPRDANDRAMICLLHDWGGEGTPGCPPGPQGQACIPAGRSPVSPDGTTLDYSLQFALALRNKELAQ
jgi:hypothetical protein